MDQRIIVPQAANDNDDIKWYNSPVKLYEGTLAEIHHFIPYFERRTFTTTSFNNEYSGINEHFDTIVRLPLGEDKNYIPIGIVSKNYTLVQHKTVLEVLASTLLNAKIGNVEDLRASLKLTEYGERMSLSILLPQQFSYEPTDGNIMAIRLKCFNSVDGSTNFRVIMEWFRLVCKNGLTIGVTHNNVRRRHLGDIQLEEIGDILISGINQVEAEKENFEIWRDNKISLNKLSPWFNKNLREKWGFKAAARAYHIASSGYDADINGSYNHKTPTTIKMNKVFRVPGTPTECRNLFDLVQILAWLAKERRDIQEQIKWQGDISDLMASLMN